MSTTVNETVGERIYRLRTNRGMSMRDLATPEYTFAYISQIESGAKTPSHAALIFFADKLDTSALYLLTGEEGDCPFCGRSA
jgi:transcriptional regulator with XRE-family HTH domain